MRNYFLGLAREYPILRKKNILKFMFVLAISVSLLLLVVSYIMFKNIRNQESIKLLRSSEIPKSNKLAVLKSSNDNSNLDKKTNTVNTSGSGVIGTSPKDSSTKKEVPSSGNQIIQPKVASYSINTVSTITVAAGSKVGPFTATTSDGTLASWTTPVSDFAGSPYGYVNSGTNLIGTSSYDYFIQADDSMKPGAYSLYIHANGINSAVRASLTINVIVTPRQYYTIATSQPTYEVNADHRVIHIPYTITRYNGYTSKVDITSNIQQAPGNNYGNYISIINDSGTGGEIVFDTSWSGFTKGVYMLALHGYDEISSTITNTFQVNVDY